MGALKYKNLYESNPQKDKDKKQIEAYLKKIDALLSDEKVQIKAAEIIAQMINED